MFFFALSHFVFVDGDSQRLSLIHYFIHCSLFISRASDNVLVICRYVTAKHRRRFLGLKKPKYFNISNKFNIFKLPGICLHHMVFAKHLTNCLFQWKQTIFHMLQNVKTKRNSRANVTDTYQALLHVVLQHENSPSRRQANHLKNKIQ